MVRLPDYGDNFPVLPGSWDPAVPWRFPRHQIQLRNRSGLGRILPWLMLGLGITLGVLLMSWGIVDWSGKGSDPSGLRGGSMTQELRSPLPASMGNPGVVSPEVPSQEPVEVVPRRVPQRTRSRLA